MISKIVCYTTGIVLTCWASFEIVNRILCLTLDIYLISGFNIGRYGQVLLLAIGIMLIWIAHKRIKVKAKQYEDA